MFSLGRNFIFIDKLTTLFSYAVGLGSCLALLISVLMVSSCSPEVALFVFGVSLILPRLPLE